MLSPVAELGLGPGELAGAIGPTWSFPTPTEDAFGSQNWEVGIAGIAVYETRAITLGVFPQLVVDNERSRRSLNSNTQRDNP